jgi:GNAT superfamily N-acetyltransferase
MEVNVKELRARLSYFMDKLEHGEEITIVRRSHIIGTIMPIAANLKPKPVKHPSGVEFRQFQAKDYQAVRQLHEMALREVGGYNENNTELDRDLYNIEGYYLNMGGEFLVGTLKDKVVAMGAFRMTAEEDQAELKRMRVHPDLQGKGMGSQLLTLLEAKAKEQGYTGMILDTWVGQQVARQFYESHGYRETHRQTDKNQTDKKFVLIFYKKEL